MIKALSEEKSFAIIPVALFKSPNKFESLSAQLWGKDLPGALDARDAANRFFGGETAGAGIVILDAEGKVAWKGSDARKGSTFYTMPGEPPVPFWDLKQNIEPLLSQGLLGGLEVPAAAKPIAKLLKSGNLALAQAMLAALKGDAAVATFKQTLTDRLEELRKKKRSLVDELVRAEKTWEAFKVAQSYVRCFPKAADLAEVKESLKALQAAPAVKSNLAAKDVYARMAAAGFGTRSKVSAAPQNAAAMGMITQKFGDTEYARYAALFK